MEYKDLHDKKDGDPFNYEMMAIDSSPPMLDNICWTLIAMHSKKYGKWDSAYKTNTVKERITAFRRDFNQSKCIDVAKLCATIGIALLPLVDGDDKKLRRLLLHVASHLVDVACAPSEDELPEGPKNKGQHDAPQ